MKYLKQRWPYKQHLASSVIRSHSRTLLYQPLKQLSIKDMSFPLV